jgi:hypothetical protein
MMLINYTKLSLSLFLWMEKSVCKCEIYTAGNFYIDGSLLQEKYGIRNQCKTNGMKSMMP